MTAMTRFQPLVVPVWLAALVLLVAPCAEAAEEEDASAAIALVGTCVGCHGADGIGKAPHYPNLRGQKAAYLEKQLRAFRSGERSGVNMAPLARDLSDAEIEFLANWFAELDTACSRTGAVP